MLLNIRYGVPLIQASLTCDIVLLLLVNFVQAWHNQTVTICGIQKLLGFVSRLDQMGGFALFCEVYTPH